MRQFINKITYLLLMAAGCLMLLQASPALSQSRDKLYVYGYFQAQYRLGAEELGGIRTKTNSFSLQQLNLLFSKNLGKSYSGFVDIESLNSFSSADGWGSLKLSEAWVRYHKGRAFMIKVGLQVPTFNNLNDIKNRTPLLPFILRPAVYESAYANLMPNYAFVPDQAFVSISGTLTSNRLKFDYTLYTGNEKEFTSPVRNELNSLPSGSDTTSAKLWGGRIGLRRNNIKFGISSTIDHTNPPQYDLTPVRRIRVGSDLSFAIKKAYTESEVIWVRHFPNNDQQNVLAEISRANPLLTDDLNKFFVHFLLGYRPNEAINIYTAFNHMEDNSNIFWKRGFNAWISGIAYKPTDPVSVKLQVVKATLIRNQGVTLKFDGFMLLAGVSILF